MAALHAPCWLLPHATVFVAASMEKLLHIGYCAKCDGIANVRQPCLPLPMRIQSVPRPQAAGPAACLTSELSCILHPRHALAAGPLHTPADSRASGDGAEAILCAAFLARNSMQAYEAVTDVWCSLSADNDVDATSETRSLEVVNAAVLYGDRQ